MVRKYREKLYNCWKLTIEEGIVPKKQSASLN